MITPSRRRGFTLVELLVVTAIFGVLFSLVIAGARPTPASDLVRSGQSASSTLMAAQSRAIGNVNGGGLIIDSGTSAGSPGIGTTIWSCEMLDPVVGDTAGIGSSGTVSLVTSSSDAVTTLVAGGYRIRFGGVSGSSYQPPSSWFDIVGALVQTSSTTARATIGYRSRDSQTLLNTIRPIPAALPGVTGTMAFAAAVKPLRSETLLVLSKPAVIDLIYSGVGHDPTQQFGYVTAAAPAISDITITFDATGAVHEVIQGAAVRLVSEPIFLLLATRDAATAGTSLADPTSVWVAIAPDTGRVVTGRNVSQTSVSEATIRAARGRVSAAVLGLKGAP